MPDALDPIRHAYGVEPAPLAPPDPEAALLADMRDVLATAPAERPDARVLAAVAARAAEASLLAGPRLEARTAAEGALLDQSQAALDRLPRPSPEPEGVAAVEAFAALAPVLTARLAPSDAAVASVLAFAAERRPESAVEAAVAEQSLAALDALPRERPSDAAVAAVLAFAAGAADDLAAVRALYADGPAVDSVEAAVLAQSQSIVETALASRPQPRPSAASVALVLAHAADAATDTLPAETAVEGALLGQSLAALDRLGRPRPAAATLDAVLVAAATATAEASATAPVATPAPAPSPTVPAAFLSGRFGAWAGGGALVLAALAAIAVLPLGGPDATAPAQVATLAEAVPADAPAPVEADAVPEPAAPAPDLSGGGAAAGLAASGIAAVAERAAPRPTAPPPAAALADVQLASTAAPAPPTPDAAPVPAWEASDDVRALSLRLQELETDDALAWDEAPAEAFGVPASPSAAGALGLQSVREGVPAARARIRPDSLR